MRVLILTVVNIIVCVPLSQQQIYLNTSTLIKRAGYDCEEYSVKTDDGYILTLYRAYNSTAFYKNSAPVLIAHSFLADSEYLVYTPPDRSLAFLLADRGYDVWLANARGTKYSRKHVQLSDKDPIFWDFSFHEIGVYDLPVMIDLILEVASVKQLHLVGHSMGNTAEFVLLSTRPEYNSKVRLLVALGPTVYLTPVAHPIYNFLVQFRYHVDRMLGRFGILELFPHPPEYVQFAEKYCSIESDTQPLCLAIMALLYGDDLEQVDKEMFPVYLTHVLTGGSKKTLIHYMQLAQSGMFQQFDYNLNGNIKVYGTANPPNYDIQKITSPVSLHYASADTTVSIPGVLRLTKELPYCIGAFKVPHDRFNHLDFVLATQVKTLLYEQVIDIISNF